MRFELKSLKRLVGCSHGPPVAANFGCVSLYQRSLSDRPWNADRLSEGPAQQQQCYSSCQSNSPTRRGAVIACTPSPSSANGMRVNHHQAVGEASQSVHAAANERARQVSSVPPRCVRLTARTKTTATTGRGWWRQTKRDCGAVLSPKPRSGMGEKAALEMG